MRPVLSIACLLLGLAAACTDDIITAPEAAPPRLNVAATTTEFCNPATITLNHRDAATPYPSLATVSGIPSGAFKVTATLKGFTHVALGDLDILLVGPGGQNVILMSDAAGGSDFQNVTVTFDDAATAQLPASGSSLLPGGTYKPTDFPPGDLFQGVVGAFGTSFAVFAGTDPNGTWKLYIWDDVSFFAGLIANGWCVNITSLNSAPVANAGGPYSGDERSSITFDGTGSTDPDNNIVSYAWDFGDGEVGSGPSPEHTYANGGTYTVKLVVTDAEGLTNEATTTANVVHIAPTATFSAPAHVDEGQVATLSLTSPSMSDPRYAFDCGSGYGEIGTASSAGCQAADNGTLMVKGKVIDASIDDLFTEYSAVIDVTNVAPVIASLTLPSAPVAVNTPVTLSAAFSDAGSGDSHTGSFELGAGGPVAPGSVVENSGTGSMSATVTFAQSGVYTIVAHVTDDDGATGPISV